MGKAEKGYDAHLATLIAHLVRALGPSVLRPHGQWTAAGQLLLRFCLGSLCKLDGRVQAWHGLLLLDTLPVAIGVDAGLILAALLVLNDAVRQLLAALRRLGCLLHRCTTGGGSLHLCAGVTSAVLPHIDTPSSDRTPGRYLVLGQNIW